MMTLQELLGLMMTTVFAAAYYFDLPVEWFGYFVPIALAIVLGVIFSPHSGAANLPRLLIVEGVISSGKTTFINSAKHYIEKCYPGWRVEIIDEAIVPSFLAAYIADMVNKGAVYAFAFQAYMAITRRYQWFNAIDKLALNKRTIFIFDRSRVGDTAFADKQHRQGFMTDAQMKIYADILWKPTGDSVESAYLRSDCLFVYLQCSPERALERNRIRNNQVEVDGYVRADFELLEDCYKVAMARVPREKLLSLDWNGNKKFDADGNLPDDEMERVFDRISARATLKNN